MPVVTRSFSKITIAEPKHVEAQTEWSTRQTDQSAPHHRDNPHQMPAEPPTPKAEVKIVPSQILSNQRPNPNSQALYVLGLPIRYFFNVLRENTQKRLLQNREWADKVFKQEVAKRRLEIEGSASHPLQTTGANTMTPSPERNTQVITSEMAKAGDSDMRLTHTTDLDSNIDVATSARPPDVQPPLTTSVPMPMSFTLSQTTSQPDDQQQSSSLLFLPSPLHPESPPGLPTQRQLEKPLSASDLLRPAARIETLTSTPRGLSQPTSSGTCIIPRRKPSIISPQILAMVSSSRSGGGSLSTKAVKRLSFERMEQIDRDPLKLAKNNELAKAVYQSPDRFPEANSARDAVLMEMKANKMRDERRKEGQRRAGKEQQREDKEQRKEQPKERKATRIKERVKEHITRNAETPKMRENQRGGTHVSKPLNILGLQQVNGDTFYANGSAVDAQRTPPKPPFHLGRKRRRLNSPSPAKGSPFGSKRLQLDTPTPIDPRLLAADTEARSLANINANDSHHTSPIAISSPIIASNVHNNVTSDAHDDLNLDTTPSFPTTMTPLSALQSLHTNLTHLAAQNAQLIDNSPGPSKHQYVPGTPAWARLDLELAAQKRPQTPHIAPASTGGALADLPQLTDDANLLEKINTFAIEIETWEADVSARLAAKKQMLYTLLAEEVEGQLTPANNMQTEQNKQADG